MSSDPINVSISPDKAFSDMFNSTNNKMGEVVGNPIILFIFFIVFIIFINLFNNLGGSVTAMPNTPGMKFIEIVMWALFIFLVLVNGLQYFFSVDIKTTIRNLFSGKPELDIDVTQKDLAIPDAQQPEVFHINENSYTYDNAKAACKAYDAELATYDQIENAYKKGAEWCSYGWSEGQMALFPTQKKTWKRLQKQKGNENACGRPGVNGGFIGNPNVRYGVNCFGMKRNPTDLESKSMNVGNPFPISKEERKMQEKINYYRQHKNDIIISPFNEKNWSSV